jgi:hypothetical protein
MQVQKCSSLNQNSNYKNSNVNFKMNLTQVPTKDEDIFTTLKEAIKDIGEGDVHLYYTDIWNEGHFVYALWHVDKKQGCARPGVTNMTTDIIKSMAEQLNSIISKVS